MVGSAIESQIREDFAFILQKPAIKGVILFGSYLNSEQTSRSDIDICIVAPNQNLLQMHKYIYGNVEAHLEKYDIRFFEEFPLYLKGEIIEKGKVILTADPGELAEYFYPYRKQWQHEKWRIEHVV